MSDENKDLGPLSMEDGIAALKQSREARNQPEPVEEEVVTEDQVEADIEAETDTETEAEEVQEDQPEEEVEEDQVEPQSDDDIYQAGEIEFTLAELKEWKEGNLRHKDYTHKTQEAAQERAQFATERQQFEAEKQQAQSALQQQHTQLQDALATFVIDQDPEPKLADYNGFDDFREAKVSWDTRAGQRAEAQQLYQAIQQEQHQATVSREFSALVGKMPELRTTEVFEQSMNAWGEIAAQYGFTPQEFAGFSDHRMFLALNDLQQLRAAANTNDVKATAAKKKVVKATKALTASAKSKPQSAVDKAAREANSRLKKTGSRNDAVAAMQARRRVGG